MRRAGAVTTGAPIPTRSSTVTSSPIGSRSGRSGCASTTRAGERYTRRTAAGRVRNTFFDDDPTWGALVDNLHVADGHRRRGIGSRLLALTADAVLARPEPTGLYLWGPRTEPRRRRFYEACGGKCVERQPCRLRVGSQPARRIADGAAVRWRQADLASGAMTTSASSRGAPTTWGCCNSSTATRCARTPAARRPTRRCSPGTSGTCGARARAAATCSPSSCRTGRRSAAVGYWDREWRGEQVYEMGWAVLPAYQGRGLATAAAVRRSRRPRRAATGAGRTPTRRWTTRRRTRSAARPASRCSARPSSSTRRAT